MLFFGSCQTNTREALTPDVKVIAEKAQARNGNTIWQQDGRMVFANRTVWENHAATIVTDDEARAFEATHNFNSRRKDFETRQIEDSVVTSVSMSSAINTDGIFQVGEWIFKLDKANETLYAINEINIARYADLVAGTEVANIIFNYSTDNEVFDAIEQGLFGRTAISNAQAKGIFCKDSGCRLGGNPDVQIWSTAVNSGKFLVNAAYNKYGVWFEIRVDARSRQKGWFGWTNLAHVSEIRITYQCFTRQRCGNESYKEEQGINFKCGSCANLVAVPYKSTRALNKHKVDARMELHERSVANGPIILQVMLSSSIQCNM